MRKIIHILKAKDKNLEPEINLDQILQRHDLDYADLSFEPVESDTLKSYQKINNTINSKPSFLKNLKLVLPHIHFKPILKPIYTIALTALVMLVVLELKKNTDPVQYAEITVGKGEKISLHVSEHFTIYLNAESSIKIPLELKRNSKIYLEGEAYFEVNKHKPVHIVSGGITFHTRKGRFNIHSRKEHQELTATVKEGSVEFYNPEFPKSTNQILNQGEKATYNALAGFISLEQNKNINYLAWNTGILTFENSSLNEVSQIISDFYNIPVSIENEDLKYKTFSASFKDAEIDEILDKIQSNLNCKISGDGSKLVIN